MGGECIMSNEIVKDVVDIIPKEQLELAKNYTLADLTRSNGEILNELDIDDIFNILKSSINVVSHNSLAVMVENAAKLKDYLEQTGQTTLLQILKSRLQFINDDYKIIENGFIYFLYERDVNAIIKVVNNHKDDRYLALTKLTDYTKMIPTEALPTVKKAREIFKYLVILHNDPRGAGVRSEQLAKDERKKKDPILFGKTDESSDKLYLICSWSDAYCDYTLPDLLDDMAKKSVGEIPSINAIDIPATVEDLINSINDDFGTWMVVHYPIINGNNGPFSISFENSTQSSTTSTNNLRIYKG